MEYCVLYFIILKRIGEIVGRNVWYYVFNSKGGKYCRNFIIVLNVYGW